MIDSRPDPIELADFHEWVVSVIAKSTGGDLDSAAVADDANLMESGIADSFSIIEVVAAIEDRFGLTIELEEVDPETFFTIAALHEFVQSDVPKAQSNETG